MRNKSKRLPRFDAKKAEAAGQKLLDGILEKMAERDAQSHPPIDADELLAFLAEPFDEYEDLLSGLERVNELNPRLLLLATTTTHLLVKVHQANGGVASDVPTVYAGTGDGEVLMNQILCMVTERKATGLPVPFGDVLMSILEFLFEDYRAEWALFPNGLRRLVVETGAVAALAALRQSSSGPEKLYKRETSICKHCGQPIRYLVTTKHAAWLHADGKNYVQPCRGPSTGDSLDSVVEKLRQRGLGSEVDKFLADHERHGESAKMDINEIPDRFRGSLGHMTQDRLNAICQRAAEDGLMEWDESTGESKLTPKGKEQTERLMAEDLERMFGTMTGPDGETLCAEPGTEPMLLARDPEGHEE